MRILEKAFGKKQEKQNNNAKQDAVKGNGKDTGEDKKMKKRSDPSRRSVVTLEENRHGNRCMCSRGWSFAR